MSEGTTRDEALTNIHDAIKLCLDVIREDREKPLVEPLQVEMIEARISDFIETK